MDLKVQALQKENADLKKRLEMLEKEIKGGRGQGP